jgi:hypothetical protein
LIDRLTLTFAVELLPATMPRSRSKSNPRNKKAPKRNFVHSKKTAIEENANIYLKDAKIKAKTQNAKTFVNFKGETVTFEDESYDLRKIEHVPEWVVDNPFILSGYRRPNSSISYYALSIFSLHNETINIWTHLIGFLLFAAISLDHFVLQSNSTYTEEDSFVFGAFYTGVFNLYLLCSYIFGLALRVYVAGAMIMFLLSTVLHTFQTMGEIYSPILARMDYIGISCMIVGSFLPVLFYAFKCEPQ